MSENNVKITIKNTFTNIKNITNYLLMIGYNFISYRTNEKRYYYKFNLLSIKNTFCIIGNTNNIEYKLWNSVVDNNGNLECYLEPTNSYSFSRLTWGQSGTEFKLRDDEFLKCSCKAYQMCGDDEKKYFISGIQKQINIYVRDKKYTERNFFTKMLNTINNISINEKYINDENEDSEENIDK